MPELDPYHKFRAANSRQTGLASYLPVDSVEVKLLDGCNRSCQFCVNEDHVGKPLNLLDAGRFNASLAVWLDDSAEVEKPEAVYCTGGEPLMVLDLVEAVVGPLAERGLTTRVVTNGTLLHGARLERLVDTGLSGVKVTYNTLDEGRLGDLMRGSCPGDTRRILANIAAAKDAGLWVFVRVGLGLHNQDEAIAIYRIMRDIGVDVVQVKPWIPSGRANSNQDGLSLSPRRLYDAFADIALGLYEEAGSTPGPEVTISCYPPARNLDLVVKDCANVGKIYCEPCGHALICNFAEEYLGSWLPEAGGLTGCVERRRELYPKIMDANGVSSCPARLNWSVPTRVVSPSPDWKAPLEASATPRRVWVRSA